MGRHIINEVGNVYGRLVVIAGAGQDKKKQAFWACECECGNFHRVRGSHLRSGGIKSCGCLVKEKLKECATTHGYTNTPIFASWSSMKNRCNNPNTPGYSRYGGRGIKVCKRWNKFENFLKDMGNRPKGKTLDRINNDGDYKPSNCRWATVKEQANNRRSNVFLVLGKKTLTISGWAEKLGISHTTLGERLRNGWSVEKTLTTPLQTQHSHKRKK